MLSAASYYYNNLKLVHKNNRARELNPKINHK